MLSHIGTITRNRRRHGPRRSISWPAPEPRDLLVVTTLTNERYLAQPRSGIRVSGIAYSPNLAMPKSIPEVDRLRSADPRPPRRDFADAGALVVTRCSLTGLILVRHLERILLRTASCITGTEAAPQGDLLDPGLRLSGGKRTANCAALTSPMPSLPGTNFFWERVPPRLRTLRSSPLSNAAGPPPFAVGQDDANPLDRREHSAHCNDFVSRTPLSISTGHTPLPSVPRRLDQRRPCPSVCRLLVIATQTLLVVQASSSVRKQIQDRGTTSGPSFNGFVKLAPVHSNRKIQGCHR